MSERPCQKVRTSMNVMARLGHIPISPDGRPWLSTRRQYSPRLMASCRMPAATKQLTIIGDTWVYLASLTRLGPAENVKQPTSYPRLMQCHEAQRLQHEPEKMPWPQSFATTSRRLR